MFFAVVSRIRKSLSARIALLFLITFSTCLAIAFVVTYFRVRQSLEDFSREVIVSQWRECESVFSARGIKGLQHFLASQANQIRFSPYLIRILNSEGETLFLKPAIQEKKFNFQELYDRLNDTRLGNKWVSLQAVDDEDKFDVYTDSTNSLDILMQVGRSSENREEVVEKIAGTFMMLGFVLISIAGIIGIWFSRRALLPIANLTRTMSRIEHGNLSERVSLNHSQDELRELGETFNRMIERLERVMRMMKESLNNVAHDIRTPLTRMVVVAERALLKGDHDSVLSALEDAAENSTEIAALVEMLLDISEADAGTLSLHKENANIGEMLNEIVDLYEFVAGDRNIELVLKVENAPVWFVDRRRLKQAVANLVDNAVKFSPEERRVTIICKLDENALLLQVLDEGPGIPEGDIAKIWDRLFRGDKSRTTNGMGLGLSLVRSIVLAHDGEVSVECKPSAGCLFSIRIPSKIAST